MPKTRQYFQIDRPDVADLTTTINDYVLVPFPLDRETTRNYWDTWHLAGVKLLRFSAADNNLKVKVMGSIDGTNFTETVEAEFSVTTATPVTKRILAYWPYLQVQVKPAVAAQHGTLSILAIGTAITAEEDTELTASIDPTGLATEATAGDIKTAVEALAVATPDTAAGDLAAINSASASIDGKLPALVDGKIPVDVSVSIAESVAVTGPLTDAQLTTQALAKESTLGSVKTAVEALAVATPDTASGDLASMRADIALMKADLAAILAILES